MIFLTKITTQLPLTTKGGPRWGPKGARAPPGPIFIFIFIFIYSYYIFYFCNWTPFKTSFPFSSISLASLIQIVTNQKLNKNNKNIHNSDCILAKKKYIYILFYHQRTKKSCVIGEIKTKFFATTINWYKYQFTVASCKK